MPSSEFELVFIFKLSTFLSRGLNNQNYTASATTFNTPGSPGTISSSYTNNKPTPPPQSSKSSPFLVTATVPNLIGDQSSDQLQFQQSFIFEFA